MLTNQDSAYKVYNLVGYNVAIFIPLDDYTHFDGDVDYDGYGVDVLGEACGAEITERLLLPTVIGMSSDSVANVR